jgi:hypothetical protein
MNAVNDGAEVAARTATGGSEQDRLPVDEHRSGATRSETRNRLGRTWLSRCCAVAVFPMLKSS